jgi:hypothetical protein
MCFIFKIVAQKLLQVKLFFCIFGAVAVLGQSKIVLDIIKMSDSKVPDKIIQAYIDQTICLPPSPEDIVFLTTQRINQPVILTLISQGIKIKTICLKEAERQEKIKESILNARRKRMLNR